MLTPYYYLIRETLRKLPVIVSRTNSSVGLDFGGLKELTWKGRPAEFERFAGRLSRFEGILIQGDSLRITATEIRPARFLEFDEELRKIVDVLARENPHDLRIWGQTTRVAPSGFAEGPDSPGHDLLDELYADRFVAPEKKPFVVDYERSTGAYMVSAGEKPSSFIDAAGQIASLAVGYNHPSKNPMLVRPELFDNGMDLHGWDVYQGLTFMLKRESGLPYANIVNSGSEAVESCLRSCQVEYPKRRKVIAFEGSFHGRTLLSIHTTYNPAKREPFEVYPGMVDFVPFPQQSDPTQPAPEPDGWLELWSRGEDKPVAREAEELRRNADPVLTAEIDTLVRIRASLEKDPALAVIVEPMQCEGGDRYGTPRFFRALRLLTRAFDSPLVFDEVQTGYGLGGPFFWHKSFNLVTREGGPDTPDAVSLAKKSQVGVCLTRFNQDVPLEVTPASIYRGYLHALEILENDVKPTEEAVETYMKALQSALGPDLVRNPRHRGLCFAFDLAEPEVAGKLVKQRFKNGLLFYPAGSQTLRFRLMAGQSRREIVQIFLGLYRCFVDLSEQDVIGKIPTFEEWLDTLPEEAREIGTEKPAVDAGLPWPDLPRPESKQDLAALKERDWKLTFRTLAKYAPQMIRRRCSLEFDLPALKKLTPEALWEHYEQNDDFAFLDLLWTGARAWSYPVRLLTAEDLEKDPSQIDELEKAVYEPERQDGAQAFIDAARNPKTTVLGIYSDAGNLVAFCVAAPLSRYSHLPLVAKDDYTRDDRALYSADLTVHPEFQGKGMGLRLKTEQYISAFRHEATVLRSRNRVPEAMSMIRMNRRLGAVVIGRNDEAYGGKGSALYQSLSLDGKHRDPVRFGDPRVPALLNKITLSNFVTPNYIAGMLTLKEALPEEFRHAYLASGRAEAVDKAMKLLRKKRPEAKFALSFEGDYFGATTGCARSLGGTAGPRYFDWPLLEKPSSSFSLSDRLSRFQKQMKKHPLDQCLGLFVEPVSSQSGQKEDAGFLEGVLKWCADAGLPVIFEETGASFGHYDRKRLFCSGDGLRPDGFTFYAGGQLGVVACRDSIFLDQPLQMISTWDGDEHSLNLLRERLLREWRS